MEEVIVLDACALIAYLNDEEGAERVETALQSPSQTTISAINLLEIAYDAIQTTGKTSSAGEIMDAVKSLPCSVSWHLTPSVLTIAAEIKANHRVSLADSVALGLAKSMDAPLMTSDHHEFDIFEKENLARFIWIR